MGTRGPKSIAELTTIRPRSAYNRPRTKRSSPPPPDHLQPATQAWWTAVVAGYELEAHQFRILQCAAESWDRKEEAREALAKHGLSYTDAKGMIRSRPECQVERDSRTAFLRALRELGLEPAPPPPGPQPWEILRDQAAGGR
jgi:phage terminase small subunit